MDRSGIRHSGDRALPPRVAKQGSIMTSAGRTLVRSKRFIACMVGLSCVATFAAQPGAETMRSDHLGNSIGGLSCAPRRTRLRRRWSAALSPPPSTIPQWPNDSCAASSATRRDRRPRTTRMETSRSPSSRRVAPSPTRRSASSVCRLSWRWVESPSYTHQDAGQAIGLAFSCHESALPLAFRLTLARRRSGPNSGRS
jgi:hypothetical protein